MNSHKNIARIVGVLMLLSFFLGVYINMFLQGPVVFAKDFLTGISENSNQVITSTLLGYINGTIAIVTAVLLAPIFKQHNKSLSYFYLGFSFVSFAMITIDNISIYALLGLSQEFVKAGTPDSDYFQTLGVVLFETRWWTHYMVLFFSGISLFAFYYLFFQSKLIPRFVSIWGLLAVLLMLTEIVLTLYGKGISMNMMLPLGLAQLFTAGWILAKGFRITTSDT